MFPYTNFCSLPDAIKDQIANTTAFLLSKQITYIKNQTITIGEMARRYSQHFRNALLN